MKKNTFFTLFLLAAMTVLGHAYAQDRSPAGERCGREGRAGDRGGSDGKEKACVIKNDHPTYEKERSAAMASEADRNQGMNSDYAGRTTPGARDAGTMSARNEADVKESDRDQAGPDKSDRGMNKEGLAGPDDPGMDRSVKSVENPEYRRRPGDEPPYIPREGRQCPVEKPLPKPAKKKPAPLQREHVDRF